MKCVCRRKCQVRVDGKIITYRVGVVVDFDECPTHFDPIEGEDASPINFLTASEDELMQSKWQFEDAYKAILKEYNIKLKRDEENGTPKSDIVSQILDARYRQADIIGTE